MIEVQREVITSADPQSAFDYLADFTTTEQWDAGSVRTVRVRGNGDIGTHYANSAKLAGRTRDVDYEVIALTPGSSIELRGNTSALMAHDIITVEPHPSGSAVTYRVEFTFRGWLRYAEPLLRRTMSNRADHSAAGLRRELARLQA
ncbi:SRPBCC family protein [Arthrobacter sp. SLBN-53]|uniref:SRPBCC family protein n=1 Tax=Arthrobacter sp. SLBN-53 TaxID=2768412 RepID=UPI00114FD818|nr:SRPBCC family protein [Arthrobacter sp. SLBN-53]TQK29966.1 polyketide cyclase/dehydrase/lipid transport protein [Arthrobacter sp. SLBN-53]